MAESNIDFIDREILKLLLRKFMWMNTNEVSRQLSISWNTADVHLKKLWEKGYLKREKKGEIYYYMADEEP